MQNPPSVDFGSEGLSSSKNPWGLYCNLDFPMDFDEGPVENRDVPGINFNIKNSAEGNAS